MMVDFDGPAYLDDHVIPIVAPAPQLVGQVQKAGSILMQLARDLGFTINFKSGKTECIISMRGPGTAVGRRVWAALPVEEGIHYVELEDGARLRLVRLYKHLGITSSSLVMDSAEIAVKSRACRVAAEALRRPI